MKRSIVLTLLVLVLMFIGAASPLPAQEPNLTTISVGNGRRCGVNGAAARGSEKGELNKLKNRFRLPSGDFEPITFDDLLGLNQGEVAQSRGKKKIVNFPDSSDPDNQRAVTLEGFVDKVFVGGCERRRNGGGESCNCNTTVEAFCDTHINVLPDEGSDGTDGRNTFIVEVTPRSRLLAARGLLSSNIGNDWSTATLKAKIEHHLVRFSGFLYFDTDHADQAWEIDPENNIGRGNFRQTAWEVHPVMGIQVIR